MLYSWFRRSHEAASNCLFADNHMMISHLCLPGMGPLKCLMVAGEIQFTAAVSAAGCTAASAVE
jgi:hypothetical protein